VEVQSGGAKRVNLPNLLTLGRFGLIPIYVVFFTTNQLKTAFLIVVLAGVTDVLDGYLARKRGQITQVGAMLDPLADKCMMLTVIISLLVSGMIPWMVAVAMFIRDAGMIIGSAFFHFRGKQTVPANSLGKLTTVLYYFAFLFIFFDFSFAIAYLWFVVGVSFVTSIIYIILFLALNRKNDTLSQ
jgi:cardiolipin synthase